MDQSRAKATARVAKLRPMSLGPVQNASSFSVRAAIESLIGTLLYVSDIEKP
jgi:hypothetical protein